MTATHGSEQSDGQRRAAAEHRSQTAASGRKSSIAGRTSAAAPDERASQQRPERLRAGRAPACRRDAIDRNLKHERGAERDGAVERFAQDVRGKRDERRIHRGDPGRPHAGARSRGVERDQANQPDRQRADERLRDLDARRRGGRRRPSGVECGQKQRIARRPAELLRRAGRRGRRRRRNPGPRRRCARARGTRARRASAACRPSREARRRAAARARRPPPRASRRRARVSSVIAQRYCRLSKRSAEICSETRPTRNTMTASMMSRTDELVTWLCVAIVQTA